MQGATRPISFGNYGRDGWKRERLFPFPSLAGEEGGGRGGGGARRDLFTVGKGEEEEGSREQEGSGDYEMGRLRPENGNAHRDVRARGSVYNPYERSEEVESRVERHYEVESRGRSRERRDDRYENRGFDHGHGSLGKVVRIMVEKERLVVGCWLLSIVVCDQVVL